MSLDTYLRRFCFAIHARPKDADPLWRDRVTGRVMAQGQALRVASEREKAIKEREKAGV